MPKLCANGCKYAVFSKKLCLNCWRKEYGKPLKQSTKPIQVKAKKVKPQTDKERDIKVALSLLKREIELEAVQNDSYYCAGCGRASVGLDKSHILAIGDRKDLELCKENIQLLCREPCHRRWESRNIEEMIKLHCFEANLEFIRLNDQTAYNKLKTKLDEYNKRYFK